MEIQRKSIGKGGVRELCAKIAMSTADPLWERQNVWKYIGNPKEKVGYVNYAPKFRRLLRIHPGRGSMYRNTQEIHRKRWGT